MMSLLVIIVATIATHMIGYIWYSRAVFGNVWMKHAGINTLPSSMSIYVMTAIAHAVVLMVLQYMLISLGLTDVQSAVQVAILLAIMVTASQVPYLLFAREPLPMFLIDHGYSAVVIIAGAVIITAM